jgi:hypothetical protein
MCCSCTVCTVTEHVHRVTSGGEILAGRCSVLNVWIRLFLLPVLIMAAGAVLPWILAKVLLKFHVFGCFLLYLRQEEETDTKKTDRKVTFLSILDLLSYSNRHSSGLEEYWYWLRVCSWPWLLVAVGKANPLYLVTSNRCIPLKNTLGW